MEKRAAHSERACPEPNFARYIEAAGYEGILYPSQQGGTLCLAVFPQNFPGSESFLEVRGTLPSGTRCTRPRMASFNSRLRPPRWPLDECVSVSAWRCELLSLRGLSVIANLRYHLKRLLSGTLGKVWRRSGKWFTREATDRQDSRSGTRIGPAIPPDEKASASQPRVHLIDIFVTHIRAISSAYREEDIRMHACDRKFRKRPLLSTRRTSIFFPDRDRPSAAHNRDNRVAARVSSRSVPGFGILAISEDACDAGPEPGKAHSKSGFPGSVRIRVSESCSQAPHSRQDRGVSCRLPSAF